MKRKMKINYDTLTKEQLEEFVEFIDWSKVPSRLLTPRVIKNFSPIFKGLQVRMWLEELLSSFVIKVDRKTYPDSIFFFKEDKLCMELDKKTGNLWCSYGRIWLVFENQLRCKNNETHRFIKNVVEMHFKNREVTPFKGGRRRHEVVKMHFKNREVTPIPKFRFKGAVVEMHFKNRENKDNK